MDELSSPIDVRPARHVHPLVWILVVGLLVRALLLVCFRNQPLTIWDEREYNELAVNLASQGQYVLYNQPNSSRPPLYPAVVAGIYKFCGLENYQAVRTFQMLTDLMTVAVLYLLGSEVYDRRIGLWAAGLYAVYPSAVGQAVLLLSETLFTFWLTLICLMIVRCLQKNSIAHLAMAGALIGLGTLTRSILWLFPPVLALYMLVAWRTSLGRRLAAVLAMLAFFAITIAPWSIRCTRLEKTFVAIDVMGGRNLMLGNYEHTPLDRSWDAISIEGEESWYRTLARETPGFRNLTQGQRDRLAMRHGLRFIVQHPWLTLERDVVKFFNFWQLERAMLAGMLHGNWGPLPRGVIFPLAALILGSYVLAMLSGLFGAASAPPDDWRVHGLLLVIIAFFCGLHTLIFAHSRYHLPLMPLILIYSASGLVNWRRIWQRRRTWTFWLAVGMIAVLVGGWVWETVAMDGPRIAEAVRALVH
jgi:4-amino-4-deoxy-L-arabinose transferase-like glycosyltransferase